MENAYSQSLDPFNVARILGTSALQILVGAYHSDQQRQALYNQAKEETWEHTFQTAGATGSKLRGAEENLRRQLFPAAMLFQSSMEAKLKIASDHNSEINMAIKNQGNFAKRWTAALVHVGQPTDEFDKYTEILYRGVRNPIVHLYDDVKATKNLEKINAVSFESVYAGVRYGWWAYTRLLHGLKLVGGDYRENWNFICSGVRLIPDLFADSMPAETP